MMAASLSKLLKKFKSSRGKQNKKSELVVVTDCNGVVTLKESTLQEFEFK